MDAETAREALGDAVVAWAARCGEAAQVVSAPCDALVSGWDTPTLSILAAVSYAEARIEAPELLPVVMAELQLPCPTPDSLEADVAMLAVLCRRVVRGTAEPEALTFWAWQKLANDGPEPAQRFVGLQYEYDLADGINLPHSWIDDAVRTAAAEYLTADARN